MLNEQQIKAAVIDRLWDRGDLQDAVLINEMVVANWSRRADIVVANGRLHAYEIKSDFDTLARLDGQVSTYLERFDKVTVITTAKFLSAVLERVPDCVEVWEAVVCKENVTIRITRRGRAKIVSSQRMLFGFLTKSEIQMFHRSLGTSVNSSATRIELLEIGEGVNIAKLRRYVLLCIKQRYASTFEAFKAAKYTQTSKSCIELLSKSRLERGNAPNGSRGLYSEAGHTKTEGIKSLNLDSLASRFGILPEDMPHTVLKRVIRTN